MKTTKNSPNEIEINKEIYVLKSSISQKASSSIKHNKMPYVVIRTYSAGVHVGWLKERKGKEVTLVDSRRIWSWEGACSLSQIAIEGVKVPDKCKFSMEVNEILLTEAIEIIQTTEVARLNIQKVPIWKQN